MDVQHVTVVFSRFLYERTKKKSVDVYQFLNERMTYDRGRPPVYVWTYILTAVDVHQFLYGRITCNIEHSRVSLWAYNLTSVDVHEILHGRLT